MGRMALPRAAPGANTGPGMPQPDPLLDEIAALLAAAESRDDPVRLERTLTDGYARALSLEAERLRLERQIRAPTDAARRRELASLERQLDALRDQLDLLRRRHSLAVRARA
jgi:hypothetical protein